MVWWLISAVVLYIICAGLLLTEVFKRTGGIAAILAMASLIGALMMLFRHSNTAGFVGIAVAIVMIPSVLISAYKVFSRTKKA